MAKAQPVYQVDRETSKQRAKDLQSYLTKWVAKTRLEEMVCTSYPDCKASGRKSGASFHEAQGHAVGDCFELSTAEGVPFRVLVVPMEAGGGETFANVARRTACVRASGRLPFQSTPHEKGRNPQMKGTTLALRLAFGLRYADAHGRPFISPEEEQVNFTDGTTAHLFECFAMANLLLCSAVAKSGGGASRATAVMRKNCARHLVATVGKLQPTLVISQGSGLVKTLRGSFGVTHPMSTNLGANLATCDLDGNQFIWAALRHPTRNWSTINQPYFRETVVPTLQQARKRALKLA